MAIEGPAGGRPCIRTPEVFPVRKRLTTISRTCACQIEDALKYSPAAAVPVRTKIPEPITAPMPSAVSDQGPRVFCRRWPGVSDSAISLSMDLQQKSWLSEVRMVARMGAGGSVVVGCDKRLWSPELSCQLSAIGSQLQKPSSLRDESGRGRPLPHDLSRFTASPGRGPAS